MNLSQLRDVLVRFAEPNGFRLNAAEVRDGEGYFSFLLHGSHPLWLVVVFIDESALVSVLHPESGNIGRSTMHASVLSLEGFLQAFGGAR